MANGERLGDQRPGYRGRIVGRADNGSVPWRLRELGFVPGTAVEVLRRGPLGDPVELELRGYRICLRRRDLTAVYVNGTEPDPA
jgi:ferrous iron transport protein A